MQRSWGRILNVSSLSALLAAVPGDAVDGATKAMVRSFSESINAELRGIGVNCTVTLPGITDTEIWDLSGFREQVAANHAYALLYKATLMSPTTVARQAYRAVMKGGPHIVHGLHHQAMGFALLHAPQPMRRRLSVAFAPGVEQPSTSERSPAKQPDPTRAALTVATHRTSEVVEVGVDAPEASEADTKGLAGRLRGVRVLCRALL